MAKAKPTKAITVRSTTNRAITAGLTVPARLQAMVDANPEGLAHAADRLSTLVAALGVAKVTVSAVNTLGLSGQMEPNVKWTVVQKVGGEDTITKLYLRPSVPDAFADILDRNYIDVKPATALRWRVTIDGEGPWTFQDVLVSNEYEGWESWVIQVVEELAAAKLGTAVAIDYGAAGFSVWRRV